MNCKVANCLRCYYAKDLCKFHYVKQWKQQNKERHCEINKRSYLKNHKKTIKIKKILSQETLQEREEKKKQYQENYREERKEQNKIYQQRYQRQYYSKNRQKLLTRSKEYRETHTEQIKKYFEVYRELHKEKARKYNKQRKQEDVNFKIACNLRTRLWQAIKNNEKSGSAVVDLMMSIADFKIYLEKQFYPNPDTGETMCWENYGAGWHIDHIIPLAAFDLTDRQQLLKAVHFSNLRPMWAKQNMSENDRGMSLRKK